MPSPVNHLLPQVSFSILFGLSVKPRHGYELLQQVHADSAGHIKLGAGALYGTLKKLAVDNLIEDMPFEGDPRRRYYRLTRAGWLRLHTELTYYEHIARLARERHLLQPGA